MQVELTQTQPNAVEHMHADVERRILLAWENLVVWVWTRGFAVSESKKEDDYGNDEEGDRGQGDCGCLLVEDGLVEMVGVEVDDAAIDVMVDCCSVSRSNMEQKDDEHNASSLTALTTKPNTPYSNDRDKSHSCS